MSFGNNGFPRDGGRVKFTDDVDDEEIGSLLGRKDRVVRMGGDSLMAGIRPRISFKPNSRTEKGINRHLAFAVRNRIDDDIRMSLNNNYEDSGSERQVVFRGRGRGPLYRPNSNHDLRQKLTQVVLSDANWYKVIIPCGQKFTKDLIIKSLLEYIKPYTFIPILYTVQERSSSFFVDDSDTAKKLLSCSNKINLNNFFKLHVYVKPGHPQCKIDDVLRDRLTKAMMKRFIQETNALDLSRFHQDSDLVDDYFCALFQPFILTTVLDIAVEHIPNLQVLNLEGNKFYTIDRLSTLKNRFANLKTLLLGYNKIRDISQIEPIRELKLEELRLSGNPLCNQYTLRQNEYVSDVRERFPKLLRLDGIDLPPPILFDVVEEGLRIPPSIISFAVNQEMKGIAGQFLQQYFSIFDYQNRQSLLNAYHEHALFSMTISPGFAARPCRYLSENRNLLRLKDLNRRRKLLKKGRLSVLSTISRIPRTRHDWDSFTMDLSLYTETMMLVTVTGLFKEIEDEDAPSRYFNRVLLIVPEGNGYCIFNEQLHISNLTQHQYKRAMNNRTNIKMTVSTVNSPINSQNMLTESSALTEEVKQNMTLTLSQETNMNLAWSFKCLNEVQWNYDNALAAFQQFFQQGLIPAEAFEK